MLPLYVQSTISTNEALPITHKHWVILSKFCFVFSHYTGDIVLFENAKMYYPGKRNSDVQV